MQVRCFFQPLGRGNVYSILILTAKVLAMVCITAGQEDIFTRAVTTLPEKRKISDTSWKVARVRSIPGYNAPGEAEDLRQAYLPSGTTSTSIVTTLPEKRKISDATITRKCHGHR